MTNPRNKLSSIFKSLHADVSAIEDDTAAVVQEEAEKWPLFKALAPRKPASPSTLTPVDKQNWLSAAPMPQAQRQETTHSAPTLGDKLAAGLNKMANPNRSTSREQAPAKKFGPPPKATRAKPTATRAVKQSTIEMTSMGRISPAIVKPEQEPASFSSPLMTPQAVAKAPPAPALTPVPRLTLKRPPASFTAVSIKPHRPIPDQPAAVEVKAKKNAVPVLATQSVDSLLSLFNLDVPSAAVTDGANASNQNDIQPGENPVDTPVLPQALTSAKPSNSTTTTDPTLVLVSDAPIEPAPAYIEPQTGVPAKVQYSPSNPASVVQTPGSLKSLLNKFQAPTNPLAAPPVKTPAFLNRLNKK